MDKADRSAATVRKASRIACRMASRCAKSQRFLLARDIGEGQRSGRAICFSFYRYGTLDIERQSSPNSTSTLKR